MSQAVLYIVATPIGNRQDISLRAVELLKSVAKIAAEDTRHSKRLLEYYQINTPLISLHEHNEGQRIESILDCLSKNESVALISDAGTPLISDPGYLLVTAARQEGYRIVPIPGACAAITALCASGLPTDHFTFEGFLPPKSGARQNCLKRLAGEYHTMIFYESTHRVVDSLSDMMKVFGAMRTATVARELTKSYETIRQDNLENLLAWVQSDANQQKGEFVIIVEGKQSKSVQSVSAEARRILSVLLEELPLKQAVSITTRLCDDSRQALYRLALKLKEKQ